VRTPDPGPGPGDARHRALRELLGASALGHLDPAEQDALRAHLDGCAACRAELAELTPLAAALRLVDPEHLDAVPTPPADLGGRILTQVSRERVLHDRRRRRRLLATAAAVAAVLALGGTGAVLLDRGDAVAPPVVAERVALVPRAPDLQVRSADLVPHTWGVEVTVVLSGLHRGERYRAVVVDRAGRQLPAGEFLGVDDRAATCDLQAALLRQDARGFLLLDGAGATVAAADLPA